MNTISANKAWKLPFVSCLLTLFAVASLLFLSHYGIDFTDEGHYLVWMANPFLYKGTVTQFAFIYHPLYLLFDGNIASLRQTNILITYGLTWIFCSQFINIVYAQVELSLLYRLTLSASLATISLLFFDTWLATPSYNSLAFQALLITAIGVLSPERRGVVIGIGGWLAFMAKPTTACALAIVVLLYLVLSKKLSIRLLLSACGTSLLLLIISAWLIDGSITDFIQRLTSGLVFSSYQEAGYSLAEIIRIDSFRFAKRYKNMSILIVPLVAILIAIYFHGFKIFSKITQTQWGLVVLFLLFPHIYAFGTNNNYWHAGGFVCIFWVMSGLVVLVQVFNIQKVKASVLLFLFALVAQLITVRLLFTGFDAPYRQPYALWHNNRVIQIGGAKSNLILPEAYAQYIEEAKGASIQAGFKAETPLLDLTGRSPGLLYALNAKSIGQAWMIGGDPGSNRLAIEIIKTIPCYQLALAWLLLEPEGKLHLSSDVLTSVGINIQEDYEQVASWQTAAGAGGIYERNTQQLMKPLRTEHEARLLCKASS